MAGGYESIVLWSCPASLVTASLYVVSHLRLPVSGCLHWRLHAAFRNTRLWFSGDGDSIGAEWKRHWTFIAPRRPDIPVPYRQGRAINAVDYFVLPRLEREGLGSSDEADRRTLIRRLYLDLTGLPSSVDDMRAVVDDVRDDAYERVAGHLLASPYFAERMVLHWLRIWPPG